MSDKKLWGLSILRMYYIAKERKYKGVDLLTRLEAHFDKDFHKGIKWCIERNYMKGNRITKRGIRFIKKETTQEEFEEMGKITDSIVYSAPIQGED